MTARAERRALLLAYYFPPYGGGGTQRPLSLARLLPEADPPWRVEVLTGPATRADRWSPRDEALGASLPDGSVHRVERPEPGPEGRWRLVAERWLGIPNAFSTWWRRALEREGVRLAADADVVVATLPPYQTAAAVARIARRTGTPWVADLRDPWAFDEMTIYPTGLHRRLERRAMRRVLRTAAAIVTTTPELARQIARRFPELADRPIESIPNGFWAEDFDRPPPPRADGRFRIVHTGSLHTELGRRQHALTAVRRALGGGAAAADVLARSHVYLLRAVEELIASRPSIADVIELHFAGVVSSADEQEASRLPQSRLHGHLDHAAAVELIRSADLLFLPMQKMPPGVRAAIVPGKLYEYLAAGRPILAAVPEGDARDILAQAGTAYLCEPDDVSAMVDAVSRELERRESGASPPSVPPELRARFERRALAARYAELLSSVVSVGAQRAASTRPAEEGA